MLPGMNINFDLLAFNWHKTNFIKSASVFGFCFSLWQTSKLWNFSNHCFTIEKNRLDVVYAMHNGAIYYGSAYRIEECHYKPPNESQKRQAGKPIKWTKNSRNSREKARKRAFEDVFGNECVRACVRVLVHIQPCVYVFGQKYLLYIAHAQMHMQSYSKSFSFFSSVTHSFLVKFSVVARLGFWSMAMSF